LPPVADSVPRDFSKVSKPLDIGIVRERASSRLASGATIDAGGRGE
jgi:hypothetical protein